MYWIESEIKPALIVIYIKADYKKRHQNLSGYPIIALHLMSGFWSVILKMGLPWWDWN